MSFEFKMKIKTKLVSSFFKNDFVQCLDKELMQLQDSGHTIKDIKFNSCINGHNDSLHSALIIYE